MIEAQPDEEVCHVSCVGSFLLRGLSTIARLSGLYGIYLYLVNYKFWIPYQSTHSEFEYSLSPTSIKSGLFEFRQIYLLDLMYHYLFSLNTFRYKGLLNCAGEHRGELCWESADFRAERPRPLLLLLFLFFGAPHRGGFWPNPPRGAFPPIRCPGSRF